MPSPVTTTPATSLRLPASWRQSKNPSIIGCVHALSFFWLANVMVIMPFAPRLVSSGICGVCSRARQATPLTRQDTAHGLDAQLRTDLVAAVLRRRMAVADGRRSLAYMPTV